MNKERVAIIVLGVIASFGLTIGHSIGARNQRITFDTMNSMLQSDKDLETVQNIKVLEGLQAKRIDVIIKFTEVRVNSP